MKGCAKVGCLGLLGVVLLGVIISAFEGPAGRDAGRPAPPPAAPSPTAVGVLSGRFAGNPPSDRIELAMTPVLAAYDLPEDEEHRLRVGSVLIALREESGIPEILLLEYMGRHPFPGVTFAEAAALAAVAYKVDHPGASGGG
ncbi:hypothetical protein [Tautonia plasticadhaerens]|uniref:Uncharacterized protein n=1 Tax=Tautonia plasticadhaerens TaxID=2527974 RepID=A0A518GZP4_9BACT|nr:hypothetical protein [Tautonia plasticadhaerens]QDV34051.1 hypothetical protein ElP_19320 [Tautonia plasticadhaerens]